MDDVQPPYTLIDRETSWLRFGHRVLQEAEDPSVPLFERLFFCGVFSSNLDEYFRVRVASLRSLLRLGRADVRKLGISPQRLLHEIHRIVLAQQEQFGRILEGLFRQLEHEGIRVVDEQTVDRANLEEISRFFDEEVRPHLEPAMLDAGGPPFLKNKHLSLVVELWKAGDAMPASWIPACALVEVPLGIPRFLSLPGRGGGREVMFLDDVIRCNLAALFPEHETGRSYAVKLTRDAELHIEDEFEGDLVGAIRRSLRKRETGVPSRFLYDMRAPYVLVHRLQERLGLSDEDLVLGGRYHNLNDLMAFPRFGRTDLGYPDWPALPHPTLDGAVSILDVVRGRDQAVHTPYQSFDTVVRFLEEAATDPAVEEVWLTVYRVARDSSVLNALIRAAECGKRVTVFFEVQARFDEASNLHWAERLAAAGARTLYSMKGLKVHAKLALVVRRAGPRRERFAWVSTGNFNEQTARVYADHGLITCDERIARDVEQVMRFLAGKIPAPDTEHLLVAPFGLRTGLERLIEQETEAARAGRPARITLKLNALEDAEIIQRLGDAAAAGVPIDIIVRGICRLVPGAPAQDGAIRVRSLVDRYLEHARIYRFHAQGRDLMFLASADWMTRNLAHRIEVAVPVFDDAIRAQLRALLDFQLADNCKARIIDPAGENPYARTNAPPSRAQASFRAFLGGERPPAPGGEPS